MNILVCVKAVPVTAQVQLDGQFRLQRDGVKLQWNIADEAALEAALQLRGASGTVTVLTMGPEKLEAPLRELLERGADRAVLLTDPKMAGADTLATANGLAAAARYLGFDLILCGRRALDGETGQVPGMVAGKLEIPCVTNAEVLSVEGGELILHRRLETGTALQRVCLPAVVSVCEYTYPLRLPGILTMRKARQKQVERLDSQALRLPQEACGLLGSATRVVAVSAQFPGLRNGPREQTVTLGASRLAQLCREVEK